jgi:hypothetical protein
MDTHEENMRHYLERGMQIIYVPDHADNDLFHKDCQPGFVTSVSDKFAFCRYWRKNLNGTIALPPDLRTKANSEATPFRLLRIVESVDQIEVEKALEAWC